MLAEERKTRILERLNGDMVVKVNELSRDFSATEATIRRDLEELQQKKLVRRIHGGATLPSPASKPLTRSQLMVICQEEKQRIARKAYSYVRENDAILLDSSTTVTELALCIAQGPCQNLTVITNSFTMVGMLSGKNGVKVVHTGGDVEYGMDYSTGVITRNMLAGIRVDKCFLGTNGIDPSFGYSVPTMDDADVKAAMIVAAKHTFVLADHTKFGECYMGRFAPFSGQVDFLITDRLPADIDPKPYQSSTELVQTG